MTDEETSEIVMATWASMSCEDRASIGEEAERADELHLAMLGSQKMTMRGEVQKDKYWTFATRMTDFWLQKWTQAQAAVKVHFRKLGKVLLSLPTDQVLTGGAFEPTFKHGHQQTSSTMRDLSSQKWSNASEVLFDPIYSPYKMPNSPGIVKKILGRFGKLKEVSHLTFYCSHPVSDATVKERGVPFHGSKLGI